MLRSVQFSDPPWMAYDQLLKHRQLEPGLCFHVCFCTKYRSALLRSSEAARILMEVIHELGTTGKCTNHAWVLMPDHIHWLLTVADDRTIPQIVSACKAIATRRLGRAGIVSASPWQTGYYEHLVRQDEDLRIQARYLVANPLRAGLVSKLADYPWWYSQWASSPHGPAEFRSDGEMLLW